jgi:protein-S-isoprenylcysteine O-methyltransferase Ste14
MISGVAIAILGVAIAFDSSAAGWWFVLFVVVNHVYFVLVEEPGLRRRFGAEYENYAANVPRWWPRWRAYRARVTAR